MSIVLIVNAVMAAVVFVVIVGALAWNLTPGRELVTPRSRRRRAPGVANARTTGVTA